MSILSSTSSKLGQVGALPKQIQDVTNTIADGAGTLEDMVGSSTSLSDKIKGAGSAISEAVQPLSTAANSLNQSIQDLQNCLDVVDTSSALVDAVVDACSGDFDAKALASAFNEFDSGWDSWAKTVNGIYSQISPSGQENILGTLAKEHFGDNIYNLGSAIKNESAGIFTGIANFESSLAAFGGSYRNPIEAAKKIETGVKGIVNATEKVSTSLNNMLKTLQIGGQNGDAVGNKVLSYLSNLHNTKAIYNVNRVLTAGGSAATMTSDVNNFTTAWKNKDLKGMYDAGKKTIDDAKTIIKSFTDKDAAAKTTTANLAKTQQKTEDKDQDSGKTDSYVCSGATIECTFGEKSVNLAVYPDRTVFLTSQPTANITDRVSMYNIPSFGKCRTTSYPPTGAATAAALGALTPMPCVPGTQSDWVNGKDDYIIKGSPALLKSSYCQCCYGGIITITDDGQK